MRALSTLLLPFFLAIAGYASHALESIPKKLSSDESQREEVLYLPNGRGLEFISFGYRNTLADLLWFQTISYFGHHYRVDQSYKWLAHMCDLVTSLNQSAEHTFLFCGTMLSWEAHDPESADRILAKGITAQPNNWYLMYLRGFNSLFFKKDSSKAKEYLIEASKIPGAQPFVAKLAAKTISNVEDPNAALEFLEEIMERSGDPSLRAAFQSRLEKFRRAAEAKEVR